MGCPPGAAKLILMRCPPGSPNLIGVTAQGRKNLLFSGIWDKAHLAWNENRLSLANLQRFE
jgi:hypothetical protein